MATKQDNRLEDFDEALRQFREEFEERLTEMEGTLSKSLSAERRSMAREQDVIMRELKHRFKAAGDTMNDGIDRAGDTVKDHPLLVVGGALAVGLAVAALLISRNRD